MKKKEINIIVEGPLNSIGNINRSASDDILFQKIVNGINQTNNSFLKENSYFGKYIIAFTVLVFLNVLSLLNFQKTVDNNTDVSQQSFKKEINEFSRTYFSVTEEYSYNK